MPPMYSRDELECKTLNILLTNVPAQYLDEIKKFCKVYKAKLCSTFSDEVTHVVAFPEEESDAQGIIKVKRTVKFL